MSDIMRNKSILLVTAISAILASFLCLADEESLSPVFIDHFDHGIRNWTHSDRPGSTMSWDADEGSPKPGSLKLLFTKALSLDLASYVAVGPCMEAAPGETWLIEAMVKKAGSRGGICVVYVSLYKEPDCKGTGTITGNSPVFRPDEWRLRLGGIRTFPTTRSARAVLLQHVPALTKTMTCHFDDVVLSNNRSPAATEVPAHSLLGLLIFASALGLTALAILARRHGASTESTLHRDVET